MWLHNLKKGLSKTGQKLKGIKQLLSKPDEAVFDEIELMLLSADVGVDTSRGLVAKLKQHARGKDAGQLIAALRDEMVAAIASHEKVLQIDESASPFVILVVGVNGSGKTTTIAKLAHRYKEQGHSVMLAAGDTFRAAAIEQIKVWGQRCDVPVIAHAPGSDSAAVIYDAYTSAKAKGVDVLIADTAGRMHTDSNLMEELKKIKRVLGKQNEAAPHETLLIADGNIGQNTLNQIKEFHQAVGISGLAITKLDGTAKGGVLFAMSAEFNLPIRFIGIGEGQDDLQPFCAADYVDALLDLPLNTDAA